MEDSKIVYLSDLTEEDDYYKYLITKSKLINKNDKEFKLWNKHILKKEQNDFDFWILLPTGTNRKILRILSDYKTIKKTITKTNFSTGYNHTFRFKKKGSKYIIYSSSGIDLYFSTKQDKIVLFKIFANIINNNCWRSKTSYTNLVLGNINSLDDINTILEISYNDLLFRNVRFGNNIEEQRNGISFQLYTIIKIFLIQYEISNGFNYDISHNERLTKLVKMKYIKDINNIYELDINKIYDTRLRRIKFDANNLKLKILSDIFENIWNLLFPKNNDIGLIDLFHKKDLVKKCPLYSVIWQDDEYITGHRFTTIMELNGYSKEIKNLHLFQPKSFNKLVSLFNLNEKIKISESAENNDSISSSSFGI